MDINQIKDQATQKGLDLLSSIRQSLGLGNAPQTQPQPQPVSAQTQSYLNTLKPIKPAFTPIQTQIQTAGQIPSPVPSVIAPIQLPKTEVSQIPTLPQIQIPSNLNAFGVSVAKPDIKQQAYNYAIGKGFLDNIANVFGEIKGELTQPIYNNSLDVNKLYFDYLRSKNPKFDTGQYYTNLLNQAYKNSGLKGTLDTVNAFTNTAVLPVWNKVKIDLANQNGLNVSPNDAYQIITGKKELNLPDVLKLDPNTTDPIKYNAIRFLDFAPNFITLPGGEGTQTFAKEVKIPSEIGKFSPNIEKVFAQKLAEYETQIGRALTPEEVNGIRQAINNPKDIIFSFQKAVEPKIVPSVEQTIPKVENITPDTSAYIKSLVKKQKEAKVAGTPSFFDKLKGISNEIDVKLQDFTTPINQAVNNAIKKGEKIAPIENPIYQIDRVLRSDSLASQYVKDNGFAKIIGQVNNLDEFNQYLIAKTTQELKKIKPNVKTGRNATEDAKLISELNPKYKELANQVYEYNRQILKSAKDYGLISEDSYNVLLKGRAEYVPINRIFSEIEQVSQTTKANAVASLSKQSLIQKLQGSEREIANPLESILTNTYKLVSQGERNIAAKQIADLVERKLIPGRILKASESFNSNEVISYLDKGVKKNVFVGKEIARAAKNLNKEASNFLVGILRVPTRILQVGAVGLNLPFIVSNIVRDQQTAAIVTGKPLRNTILNPVNFVKAIYEASGEGKVYDDFIRAGAGYSSLDITRDTAKTVQQLKDEASPFVKASKTILNPAELFKAIEDVISKGETATRLQVFKTTYDDLIKQGESIANANILAADAARNATANFARRGEYGTVLNAVIPFFNATVQGARTLRNSFVTNPLKTTAIFASTVGVPTAISTLWNIETPERKKAYDMIPEYEKENNLIILPPNVTYDEKGYPFYFRLPKPQGYSQLANPVRKLLEKSYESNPDAVLKITNDILSGSFGVNLPITEESRRQLTAQYTPQILKPAIESQTGVNLYTGQKIIPMGLEKLPPQEQVKETTSFTARKIGSYLNISPLLVENTLKTSTGGLGEQILNLSDRYFAKTNGIPEQQIGGRDPFQTIINVFYRATGGADVQKIYQQLNSIDTEKALLNLKIKQMILNNDTEGLKSLSPNLTKQQFTSLENSVSENEFAKTLSPQNRALFNSTNSQLESLKQSNPNLSNDIDNILQLKQQLKEKQKIDINGFNFKPSTTSKVKVKTQKVATKRLPKPKKPILGNIKKPRILNPKPIKKIKFKKLKKPIKLA